jgi:hypothetical protein
MEIVWIYYGFSSAIANFIAWTSHFFPVKAIIPRVLRSQPTGGSAAAANASGDMIIIENSDQILPFFAIHR